MQRNIPALSSQRFDLLVIGAGVHGACVARDAALRGLKVAIIDKTDIGGATSHNSLKTIHGGIRYLQHLNFKRTLESIKEQKYWLQIAPHLVKPQQFMMPTYGYGMRGPIAMYIGIRLFELLSLGRNRKLLERSQLARGKILSRDACLAIAPDVPVKNLTGGAQWDEAQVEFADQAIMQIIQHAADIGTVVANYVSAGKLIQEDQAVVGVEAVDELTRQPLTVKAKIVVNATGPWVTEVLQQSSLKPLRDQHIAMSKSMNVVTRLPAKSMAIGVQSTQQSDSRLGSSKRLYFMVPWNGLTMIGTTHFPFQGQADSLVQIPQEINAFVEEINLAYPSLDLTTDDVIYCYQGLGPADNDANSKATQLHHSKVTDHAMEHKISGLISIISVKWTTARIVAEKTVDLVVQKLTSAGPVESQKCQTRYLLIPDQPQSHARFYDLSDVELSELCLYHIKHTMTLRLGDMLLRRTNDLVSNRLTIAQIRLIAKTMAQYFSWSETDRQQELALLRQHWLAKDISHQLDENDIWSSTE